MDEALQRAVKGLQVSDVSLKKTSAYTVDSWDPKRSDVDDVRFQFLHSIDKSEIIDVEESVGAEINDSNQSFFRVYITLGSRVVKDDNEADELVELARIEATFITEYAISESFDKSDVEALKAFALKNASFHAWPYWREYLMSMCTRLNLPKIPLPMRQF